MLGQTGLRVSAIGLGLAALGAAILRGRRSSDVGDVVELQAAA